MVNTEIRLIIFFAAKEEKLCIVSKNKTGSWLWLRSWLLIAKFRLKFEEIRENRQTIQVWPKSNPLQVYAESDK